MVVRNETPPAQTLPVVHCSLLRGWQDILLSVRCPEGSHCGHCSPSCPLLPHCCPGMGVDVLCLGSGAAAPFSRSQGHHEGHGVRLPSEKMPRARVYGWGEWDASVGVDDS